MPRHKYCPATNYALAPTATGVAAAWEYEGGIYFAAFDASARSLSKVLQVGGDGGHYKSGLTPASDVPKHKSPFIAENGRGERLIVWTEGVLWNKGGSVAWQVYGADHKPIGETGNADGVPASSLATAFSRADGSFVIIF